MLKNFYKARKNQVNHSHIITALEFTFPDEKLDHHSSSEKHYSFWRKLSSDIDVVIWNLGFSSKAMLEIYKRYKELCRITDEKNAGILNEVDYPNIDALREYCYKNSYGVLTENDFFWPDLSKFHSLNNQDITGEIFLFEQKK